MVHIPTTTFLVTGGERAANNFSDQITEWEEMRHHSMSSNPSQRSLVRTPSTTTGPASIATQGFEMTGAFQGIEGKDDLEREGYVLRRLDTEMGGRSQASGLESGQLQRRSTYPVPADDARHRNKLADCAADVASGPHGAVEMRDDLRYQAGTPV